MGATGTRHVGSLLWRAFPTADAALAFFGAGLRPAEGEAVARVARGESSLVRMGCPGPIDWARRSMITCEARGDGGVRLFLADLDLAAPTRHGVLANIEATRRRRPEGPEMWWIETWTPPPPAGATPPHREATPLGRAKPRMAFSRTADAARVRPYQQPDKGQQPGATRR